MSDLLAHLVRAIREVYHNGTLEIEYIPGIQVSSGFLGNTYVVRIHEDGAMVHDAQDESLVIAVTKCSQELCNKYKSLLNLQEIMK